MLPDIATLADVTPEELKEARHSLGLSQDGMARAMNTPLSSYKQWEQGRRAMAGATVRCVELLLTYPRSAKALAKKPRKAKRSG